MNTLFISGATFHVILQMGALKHILQLSPFQNFVGTSSGSYLALAIVLGWTPDTLYEYIKDTYPSIKDHLTQSYLRLFWYGSLVSSEGRDGFISDMISNSPIYTLHFRDVDPRRITFNDLAQVTDNNFLCNAVCYESRKTVLFSKWTTPNVSIHSATAASQSLLGLYHPTVIDELNYIDGGYLSSYVPSLFDSNSGSYYKELYPEVDIPIYPETSWGCLNISEKALNGIDNPSPSGPWSSWKLIKFIPYMLMYGYLSSIRKESLDILQNRSWLVHSNVSSTTLPDIATGEILFSTWI